MTTIGGLLESLRLMPGVTTAAYYFITGCNVILTESYALEEV